MRDRARLRTSKGVFATYPGLPLPLACYRVLSLFGARWQRETPSGLQPCRRGACHRQTTSVVSASGLNRQNDAVEEGLTSCFLTGRSSSLVAASSIDGLPEQCYLNATELAEITYHSSEDSESVKVGVGLRFRFRALLSSTEATASLSARRLLLPLYEDDATGGGDAEALS